MAASTMTALSCPVAPAPALSGAPSSLQLRVPQSAALAGRATSLRLKAVAPETSFAGEDSPNTVFPAEACEELGGEFCEVEGVGKEVKPAPAPKAQNPVANFFDNFKPEVGTVDYDGPKTVFPGEACDELGGEFCEPQYQEGVGKEVKQ